MNRSNHAPEAGDGLPEFFDATGSDDRERTEEHDETKADESDDEEDAFAAEDEQGDVDDSEFDEEVEFDEDPEPSADDWPTEPVTTPRIRRHSRRQRSAKARPGGGLAIALGLLVAGAGIAAAVLPAMTSWLGGYGFEPQVVIVLGVCLLTLGASQRRIDRVQRSFEQQASDRDEADAELRDTLAELLEYQRNHSAEPAAGEELQHVLLSLQRQDQKINNLTKAIKMYGKPLMEIAGQATETTSNLAQLKTRIEADAQSTERKLEELAEVCRSGTTVDLGDLPQRVDQLGVTLAAISQRLEDSDVRKSLLKLEDRSEQLHNELQALQRGDAVQKAADGLQQRLDDATRGLQDGLAQLRDGDLGGLENSVREIQREVSGLATAVAHIQAAVKGGVRTANAAPAPADAPATAHTAASNPAPATAAPANTAPAGEDSPQDASGYATGKRKSTGKNVLGAIAKLKQMKG